MAWRNFRAYGILPRAGGWQDQPLKLLCYIDLLEQAYTAGKPQATGESLNVLTPYQADLIRWLEDG